MIIVDDYNKGKIHAGQSKHDLDFLPKRMIEAIDSLTDENTDENPIHIDNSRNDFYVFYMDEHDVFNYMAERDCTNCITGV